MTSGPSAAIADDIGIVLPEERQTSARELVTEIEAEATAYVATRHLGPAGTSHANISHYPKDSAEAPRSASFHMIAKVAGGIENMALGTQRTPRTKAERVRRRRAP